MLQNYPAAVRYLTAGELDKLAKKPPDSLEDILQTLARLLPLLGDEFIPVWQSDPLPSQPVALVSFLAKSGQPLVAVICESGLLWVADAAHPDKASTLQLPGVRPGGARVRGLFACPSLRSFGYWTELLIPVVAFSPDANEEAASVYRVLAGFQNGEVVLTPAVEDAIRGPAHPNGGSISEWPAFPLTPEFRFLLSRTDVFAGGVDPLAVRSSLSRGTESGEVTLRLWGKGGSLVVEGRSKLRRLQRGGRAFEPFPLNHPVKSGVVLKEGESLRVALAQEGRRLQGLALRGESWKSSWEQRLQYEPVAIDCGLEPSRSSAWPDLFLALDDRRTVRLGWQGARKLTRIWKELVAKLGAAAQLRDASDWAAWTCSLSHQSREAGDDESRARRRVLHYLAVDQALTVQTAAQLELVLAKLVDQVVEEFEADLLLPAAWRLLEALKTWETKVENNPLIPDVVWKFYEKVPFSVQELFDAHLRSWDSESQRGRSWAYDELLTNSTNVVTSYQDTRDPLRDVGIQLLRVHEAYVTASINPGRESFRFRHLVSLDLGGEPHLAAVGALSIRLHRLVVAGSSQGEMTLQEIGPAAMDLGPLFTAQFARVVSFAEKASPVILLGSLQGELAVWEPGRGLKRRSVGGSLSAAAVLAPAGTSSARDVLVIQNLSKGAHLLHICLQPGGEPEIAPALPMRREIIQSLEVFEHPDRYDLICGAGEDLVIFGTPKPKLSDLVPRASFPLGGAVTVVAALPLPGGVLGVIACNREGEVFSLSLGAKVPEEKRFQWIYQVPRGVSGILSRSGPGSPCGVIGADGSVTLLTPEGSLVHEYRPNDPVEAGLHLTVAAREWFIVGSQSGEMTVLQRTSDSAEGLRKAEEKLAKVGNVGPESPGNEARELGWLFARFRRGDDPCGLYQAVRFRVSKAALVHLVSLEPGRVRSRVKAWVEILSLSDLADFLRRLPLEDTGEWVLQSWDRLLKASDKMGERGVEDEAMALYELLRPGRREKRLIPGDRLRSLPGVLLESDWISFLVAQYLWDEIAGKTKRLSELLAPALAALASFPLRVARVTAMIASGSEALKDLARVLESVVKLGETVARKATAHEIQAALRHLGETLTPWLQEPGASGAFARFVCFVAPLESEEPPEERWRRFLELLLGTREISVDSALHRLLFRSLANWLPGPPPGPDSRLTDELAWLQSVAERASQVQRYEEEAEQGFETPADLAWKPLYDELLHRGRKLLGELSTQAADHLRNQVRLHLRLRGNRYLFYQVVSLEIEILPESLKRVTALAYTLALNGLGGLGATDKELIYQNAVYQLDPGESLSPHVWTCEGKTAPGQDHIIVQGSLTWDGGSRLSFEISLPLPPPPASSPTSHAPLPDAIPTHTRELVKAIQGIRTGCTFVLLDDELGRKGLLRRLEGPGVRHIDLDAALKDVGPTRAYPDLLTVATILKALRSAQVLAQVDSRPEGLGPGDQLLVAPCDNLWDRLLSEPSLQQTLKGLMAFLGNHRSRPALVFFVRSEVGARLRPLRRRGVDWLNAFRLDMDRAVDTKIINEAVAWLSKDADRPGIENLALSALQRLGGDLRLCILFRRLISADDLTPGGVDKMLTAVLQSKQALDMLHGDLQALTPEAMHLLIVAARSQTTLRFQDVRQGLISVAPVLSTGKGGKKGRPILAAGQRIDAHTAESLRSDSESRSRTLMVFGYSPRHAVRVEGPFEHLALFIGGDAEIDRMASFLAAIGAVDVREGVIRTLSPYRELIAHAVKEGQAPAQVYGLLSRGSSPLASWSLSHFSRLSMEKISQVDGRIQQKQATMLHHLGLAWNALADRRPFAETTLRNALSTLTGRDVAWLAGSGKNPDHLPRWEGDTHDLLFEIGAAKWQREMPYYLLIVAAPSSGQIEQELNLVLLDALLSGVRSGNASEEKKDQSKGGFLLVARPGRPVQISERRWLELGDQELRDAALNQDWEKAFWGLVRTRAGLKTLAPFKREGALPPGSPVFAGREDELNYMLRHIRAHSFLIVGSRQVGKTSLLNEFRFRLKDKKDVACFYLDLQGLKGSENLNSGLVDWAGNPGDLDGSRRGRDLFLYLIDLAVQQGCYPVFLLNEIDKLLQNEVPLLEFLRGLHDSAKAQFVMTGYMQAAEACRDPKLPFYHWTSSPDGKRKYLVLAELNTGAVEQIVRVLEYAPLELVWETPDAKLRGIRLILDRSYKIPYLVQSICMAIVERLEKAGRYVLRYDDVLAAVNQGGSGTNPGGGGIWSRVNDINLAFAAPELRPELARPLVRMILYVAMKNLYFSGAEPVVDSPLLPSRDARSMSFTSGEAREWLAKDLKRLLVPAEVTEAERVIQRIDFDQLLSALSLTLLLAYAVEAGRYFFPSHLLPRELHRNLRPGELIDDKIIELTLSIAHYLSTSSMEAK